MHFLNFYCYFTIGPSVGNHVCFDDHQAATNKAGQWTIALTKFDISDDISFLCHPVIALLKASGCDKEALPIANDGYQRISSIALLNIHW